MSCCSSCCCSSSLGIAHGPLLVPLDASEPRQLRTRLLLLLPLLLHLLLLPSLMPVLLLVLLLRLHRSLLTIRNPIKSVLKLLKLLKLPNP